MPPVIHVGIHELGSATLEHAPFAPYLDVADLGGPIENRARRYPPLSRQATPTRMDGMGTRDASRYAMSNNPDEQ
jgi:hypothetical protein